MHRPGPISSAISEESSKSNKIVGNPNRKTFAEHTWSLITVVLGLAILLPHSNAQSRSTYIPYDSPWVGGPGSSWMALDIAHKQIFTAWPFLDRVDVLSTSDYHLIRSIPVPSPSTLDISPDGSTVAVGTLSSHILFFSTSTFAKTNDIVFQNAALGISAFLYTANGNAVVRAEQGISTGGGITAYWDHASNTFRSPTNSSGSVYQTSGPLARSGDYSKILLGDATSGGVVQVIDGNTGNILWPNAPGGLGFGGYIYALGANTNASRYAVCVAVPGYGPYLVVLDSGFNQLYQDQQGCLGMKFSADGGSLYRDINIGTASYTQVVDMTTFTTRNVMNYFTSGTKADYPTFWQAADTTGVVYGTRSNDAGLIYWIAIDTSNSTTLALPVLDSSVKLLRVIDNAGSPQGGDTIRLLATGVTAQGSQSVTVTIGGASATNVQVISSGNLMPNQVYIAAVTPPGTPGQADVALTVNGVTSTASQAFQYAASRIIIPFSTSPSFLIFDPLRNRLYASHKNQVEVIDASTRTLLSPLVPASGILQNSQFQGISLSPDGNRLYIADAGAGLIHILDLSTPGKGVSINVGTALGSSSPISPNRVFELSNGNLIGSSVTLGSVFFIDRSTSAELIGPYGSGNRINGSVWNTSNGGENALIATGVSGWFSGALALWSTKSPTALSVGEVQGMQEADVNADGTVIIDGGSGPTFHALYPQILDFNVDSVGYIKQHFDVDMPTGAPSFFLHPSGALLFKAGYNNLGGTRVPGGTVEVDDMHLYQPALSVAFPEPFVSDGDPYLNHTVTADPTGRMIFGVTQSGITIITLNAVPLSIGNVQPAFIEPQVSQSITLRGSGFAPGVTTTIGGTQAATNYVDPNTLTITTPALDAGWADVTVKLPSGTIYTASNLLHVIAAQPTPGVTGFSPASFPVQVATSAPDTTITILGSGFESYDTVELNGQLATSAFIDSGQMQVNIPAILATRAGSISIAVISPYTGSSNTLALPLVNPIPILEGNRPITIIPGNTLNLSVSGRQFVQGSTIQWNGQNLTTILNGGQTPTGLINVSAFVPANLTTQEGTATVTVFNPPPGGGVSNPFSVDVSPAHALVYLTMTSNNNNSFTTFYDWPASIDFGNQIVGSTIANGLNIWNVGTATYTLSSATVSSGAFSTSTGYCPSLAPPPIATSCSINVTFAPSTIGATSATYTITDNATGSPHVITLTGAGIAQPLPSVTISSVDSLGSTTSASVQGATTVGGVGIGGTAWIEYGTDPTLATFSKSASWTFTGNSALSGTLSGLSPGTQYAARLAVQTAGGTGKSAIKTFSTFTAASSVSISLSSGGSNSATVKAGGTATWNLNVSNGANGYVGTATFICTGTPVAATCTVTPTQVTISNTPSQITVNVATTAARSASLVSRASGSLSLALCFLFGTSALALRRRLRNAASILCLIMLAFSAISCGGGGSGSSTTTVPVTPTPPGTYVITINATAGTAQDSIPLSLTVQ